MKYEAFSNFSANHTRRDILNGSAKELIDPDTLSHNIHSSHESLLIYKIVEPLLKLN